MLLLIKKIYNYYLRNFTQIKSKIIFFLLKKRYPYVKFGKNLLFFGIPVFKFFRSSKILISSNVTFRSTTSSNFVGLNKRCSIYVENEGQLTIGENSGFSGVSIYCSKKIIIGQNVQVGGNVNIWDTDFHPINYLERRNNRNENIKSGSILIGDDVFIGANSIILKGVTVGDRSIIGAGSVVTKSIPHDEIWAGNPVKFIKKYINDDG